MLIRIIGAASFVMDYELFNSSESLFSTDGQIELVILVSTLITISSGKLDYDDRSHLLKTLRRIFGGKVHPFELANKIQDAIENIELSEEEFTSPLISEICNFSDIQKLTVVSLLFFIVGAKKSCDSRRILSIVDVACMAGIDETILENAIDAVRRKRDEAIGSVEFEESIDLFWDLYHLSVRRI